MAGEGGGAKPEELTWGRAGEERRGAGRRDLLRREAGAGVALV